MADEPPGGILICLKAWVVPLFGGTFFLKNSNYRCHLKKHAESWVSFWENIAKFLRFTDEIYVILRFWVKDMQKLFNEFFDLRNYRHSFHRACGIMGRFFQTCAKLWVRYFNQNGMSSSKIRPSNHPDDEPLTPCIESSSAVLSC